MDYSWYQTLIQPPLTPPSWVFSPAWTFLYLSLFISLILFARKRININKTWGYILFFTQLFVNLSWSVAFFYAKNIPFALIIIILLDILVLFNIIEFIKISKLAGYILIPYFIWILFATYLNIGFIILN